MQLTISSVDYAPEELHDQIPVIADLIRELPGDDRPDYWLAKSQKPIRWIRNNIEREITHLIVAARWAGTAIHPNVENLPVGIAYVTEESLIDDDRVTMSKCEYVAIGIASESSGRKDVPELKDILSGRIAGAFGMGTTDNTEQGEGDNSE